MKGQRIEERNEEGMKKYRSVEDRSADSREDRERGRQGRKSGYSGEREREQRKAGMHSGMRYGKHVYRRW